MRSFLILVALVLVFAMPASAIEITAPPVPEIAADVMPEEPDTFAEGLWQLVKAVCARVQPSLMETAALCMSVMAAVMLITLLQPMTGKGKKIAELVCTLSIAAILLGPTDSLIRLGVQTVGEMTEYGKLLLPVMTAAMAAQGGVTTSAALYSGTAVFNTFLSKLIAVLLVPVVYTYLALAVADSAVGENTLKKLRNLIKWCGTWILKTGLGLFTAFMSFTGVISGTADKAALKVTKMAISTAVPVIGGVLSNASETVLISAGMVKNAAGVYGMLAILSVYLEPFMIMGIEYLLLKFTAAVCGVFATSQATELIGEFSSAMGFLLAATGTICLMLLISTVCFMKGVN